MLSDVLLYILLDTNNVATSQHVAKHVALGKCWQEIYANRTLHSTDTAYWINLTDVHCQFPVSGAVIYAHNDGLQSRMKTSKQESPVFVPSLQREAATQAAFSLTGSPATFNRQSFTLETWTWVQLRGGAHPDHKNRFSHEPLLVAAQIVSIRFAKITTC